MKKRIDDKWLKEIEADWGDIDPVEFHRKLREELSLAHEMQKGTNILAKQLVKSFLVELRKEKIEKELKIEA